MASSRLKKLVKITTNNQVAIPSFIVRNLHLSKGALLEVTESGNKIVMTPKHLVDDEDYAMYQGVIQKGHAQFEKGETVAWEDVKKKLDQKRK